MNALKENSENDGSVITKMLKVENHTYPFYEKSKTILQKAENLEIQQSISKEFNKLTKNKLNIST